MLLHFGFRISDFENGERVESGELNAPDYVSLRSQLLEDAVVLFQTQTHVSENFTQERTNNNL